MLSGNSEGRFFLNFAFNTEQSKPAEILYHEADICHVYESNVLSPQGELTCPTRMKFELRLIHTFMSLVAPVQAGLDSGHASQGSVTNLPMLATKYIYARDIILGCSALYLRAYNPNDKLLVRASHEYAVRAIAECSRQIQHGVQQDNAEGLFFASMFVAKHALASRQYDSLVEDNTLRKQDTLPLLRWLRQFRGIKAVLDAGWAWIPQIKHLSPMLSALAAPAIKPKVQEETVFSNLLEGLDEIYAGSAAVEAYRVAVTYLDSVIQDPDLRGVAGFPIAVPDRFIELLEERDPRAMTIVGSYLALFALVAKPKILVTAAKREFRVIIQQLPLEWLPKMTWATGVIESTKVE